MELSVGQDFDHPHGDLVPDGRRWALITQSGHFVDLAGPMFTSFEGLEPDEPARFGFRVQKQHTNGVDVCHGGMLATFLDLSMARGLLATGGLDINVPTVSLTMDFIGPGRLGDWVESRVAVLHRTRRTAFVQATLAVGETLLIRGSAVFRITPTG